MIPGSMAFHDRLKQEAVKSTQDRKLQAHQRHREAAAPFSLAVSAVSVGAVHEAAPLSEAEEDRKPVADHVVVDLHAGHKTG